MQTTPTQINLPVVIIGAGPIGLITALGLAHYGIASVVYEDDAGLSLDTKAGTLLSRTLEIFRRYGVADAVLAQALRVDEIGEIDRKTQRSLHPLRLDVLTDETRYPFVINLPQQDLEPVLADAALATGLVQIKMQHRYVGHQQAGDHVVVKVMHGDELIEQRASFLLGCDGGHSAVREQLGFHVEGHSLPVKYALVDLVVDLDMTNPRDYPYLAYFADAQEWMILVRQPHCWRFLFPMDESGIDPTQEELRDKALAFIGEVNDVKVIQHVTYRVHHRVATQWRDKRVMLMGDAAHLITPMWALGLNTGALDASNLPWRLSWFLRGWANESLLDGYEREQRPLAIYGCGEMAEAARHAMAHKAQSTSAMTDNNWSNAYTRTLLGVRLDVDAKGEWSLVCRDTQPALRAGDRICDVDLHSASGRAERLHDLCKGRFTALYFSDIRRRPVLGQDTPALQHRIVSRYDAPHDSGLRERSLLDPGNRLARRLALPPHSLVLLRPDEHVAAIVPLDGSPDQAAKLYQSITGRTPEVGEPS